MNPSDPVHVFCTLFGITPADLVSADRVLGLDPNERDPAVIEAAAGVRSGRIQSIQHQLPTDHIAWMRQVVANARAAMLQAATPVARPAVPALPASWPAPPVPQVPSAPSAAPYATPADPEPTPIVRTHMPRYSRGPSLDSLASAVGGLMMCGLVVAGVGWFVNQSWEDLQDKTSKKPVVPGPGLTEPDPNRKSVGPGGGKRSDSKSKTESRPVCAPVGKKIVAGDAKATLQEALKLARQGSFDEARRVADRAHKQLPDASDGLGYIISYAEQYSRLADEALKNLNGSNEVDLGPPYGKAQFVEQTPDEITFFARGKHKTFTLAKFNGLKGARFRVFRTYLDNAALPANDLIIGSYEFLLRINEQGVQDANGGMPEAENRFRKVLASGNTEAAEHATLMLAAVDLLGPAE